MAIPPTLDYIMKFMPKADENGICHLLEKEEIEKENKKQKNNDVQNNQQNKRKKI